MKNLGATGRGWVAVCALAVGCGDGGSGGGGGATCGEGTEEVDGVCVAVDGSGTGTGGSGDVTCGEGTEEVDGVCEVVDPSTGVGGTTSGGSAGDGGTSGSGTTGDGGTAGDGGSAGDGGTSSTDAGGAGGTDAGGAGGTGAGGAGGTGAGGAGTGGSTGGSGGSGDPISTEPFACGSRDVTGATVVQGAITTDTTWSGLIHVAGDVSVRNEATLTIEPGTKIIVGLDYEIDFGWEDSSPTLVAEGTPEAPILFCGETERAGYWKSLSLQHNVNPDSVLRNVLIADAGSSAADATAALVLNTPALVQGVQVVGAQRVGVETSGFGEGSEALRVTASGVSGRVTDEAGIRWPANSDLSGNEYDFVLLAFSHIGESVTFEDHGAEYLVTEGLTASSAIADPIVITFEAGVTVRLPEESGLWLNPASIAKGTSDAKVTFKGAGIDEFDSFCIPGDSCFWGGGTVFIGNSGTSSFEHTVFQYLMPVEVAGTVKFEDVEIKDAQVESLLIDYGRLTPDSSGLTISAQASYGVVVRISGTCDSATLPADTVLPANRQVRMNCTTFETDTVIHDVADEYEFVGNAVIEAGAHVTVGEGVRLNFGAGHYFHVEPDAGLSIQGTASDPVELDGPLWAGLRVESSDVDVDHAQISNAGSDEWQGVQAAITTTVPISVTNTSISDSEGYGIAHSVDDDTDYTLNNTFENNADADTVTF